MFQRQAIVLSHLLCQLWHQALFHGCKGHCFSDHQFKLLPELTILFIHESKVQSNLAIRNFLGALKLFLNAKSSLSLWSKWQIGHRKWFLNTNLFLIKQFLIAKFDCTSFPYVKPIKIVKLCNAALWFVIFCFKIG